MHIPELKDKCVLISGASSGIGSAVAILFASQGCFVGIHYNKSRTGAENTLKQVEKWAGGCVLQADLNIPEQIQDLVDQFVEKSGRLDILVNNVGGMIQRISVAEAEAEYYDRLFQLNVRHVFLLSRAALTHLKKTNGNIINIGSVSGHSGGFTGSGIYAAMKSAVATGTIAMAKEFALSGIRVNSVLPGFIDTPFHDGITGQEQKIQILKKTPLGRFGTAEDVANAVVFLSSDKASFITGEYIAVNGGLHMRV